MSSSSKRRRARPQSSYEPLLQSIKSDKPRPPPKPPLTKSLSSTAMSQQPSSPKERSDAGGSYFQSAGGSSIGYCLSSFYKVKVGPKVSDVAETSSKLPLNKPKFVTKGDSRPPLLSLPAKFQVSYNERNKQSTGEKSDSRAPLRTKSVSSVRQHLPSLPIDEIPENGSSTLFDLSKSLDKSSSGSESCTPTSNSHPRKLRPSSVSSHFSLVSSSSSSSSLSLSMPSPSLSATESAGTLSEVILPVIYAQPLPREIDYTEREHPRKSFEYLNMLRQKRVLCDATLSVNSKELMAHRVVLAACSQYFESMFVGEFAEPAGEPVMIEEVSEDALEAMVEFAYTSHLKLTDRNVLSMFEAADFLQFTGVKGACFRFFKQQINKSNCIMTWLFAEDHQCMELVEASLRYIESNFVDIAKGREFLSLDRQDVIMSLIGREDLAIASEEQVYEAALAWIKYKQDQRKMHTLELFKCVRFASIPKDYLLLIVDHEPLIQDDPDLLQLLIEALESHMTRLRGTLKRKKKEKTEESASIMKPRAASMAIDVIEIHRLNTFLGLRIMGGRDRPHHVFRQGVKPGIFILEVLDQGAAAQVGKLRVGDRIIKVNGSDMTTVTHEEAISLLKTSNDPLTMYVRHEPPPARLRELTLVTRPGEGFGFTINGGVSGYSGNPLDETDEGIFISQVVPGGAAHRDQRLTIGTRILQINSISLLGKTYEEALKVQLSVMDRLQLLVCDGYNPDQVGHDGRENMACISQETVL